MRAACSCLRRAADSRAAFLCEMCVDKERSQRDGQQHSQDNQTQDRAAGGHAAQIGQMAFAQEPVQSREPDMLFQPEFTFADRVVVLDCKARESFQQRGERHRFFFGAEDLISILADNAIHPKVEPPKFPGRPQIRIRSAQLEHPQKRVRAAQTRTQGRRGGIGRPRLHSPKTILCALRCRAPCRSVKLRILKFRTAPYAPGAPGAVGQEPSSAGQAPRSCF